MADSAEKAPLEAPPADPGDKTGLWLQILTVIGLVAFLAVAAWAWHAGYLTDDAKMKALLTRSGIWAPLIFILIQIIQCVLPIIPGGVSLLIGVVIFGPLWGFIYNYVGIVLGSIGAFLLARAYGRPLVKKLTGEKTYNKYIGWLDKNPKKFFRFFAITMLAPGMPDDFICMLAGLTEMPLRTFVLTLLWTKPPTILVYTFFLDHVKNWASVLYRWLFLH